MDELFLFLQASDDDMVRRDIVIKFILGQVNPHDVDNLISELLANRKRRLAQTVRGQINAPDFGLVEKSHDLTLTVICDPIVPQAH